MTKKKFMNAYLTCTTNLRKPKKKAEERDGDKDYSSYLDWHKAHEKGRDLWEKLASCALNNIDQNSKGNSKLFKFMKEATAFEDILYGLEPYYRDHTLHSLWVYFLGEHILRDYISDIHENLNWYLYNDIERDKTVEEYSDALVTKAKEKEQELCEEINSKRDAIWCITALCHDLGYSLSKLDELNQKVINVLNFFDLSNYRQFGYSFDVEDQYIVTQFLELMAMDIRLVPPYPEDKKGKVREEVVMKCYRDDSSYWRLCRALEGKRHGIVSSYIIYGSVLICG